MPKGPDQPDEEVADPQLLDMWDSSFGPVCMETAAPRRTKALNRNGLP